MSEWVALGAVFGVVFAGCLAILLVILVTTRALSVVATSPINQTQIVDFLNQTINWYQQIAVGQPESPSPNDILFATSNLPLADQVVKLSFDFDVLSTFDSDNFSFGISLSLLTAHGGNGP